MCSPSSPADEKSPAANDEQAVKAVTFQSDRTRRGILLSYWVVILLAVPLWWTTTSITRLALPEDRVRALSGREPRFQLDVAFEQPEAATSVLRGLHGVLKAQGLERTFGVNYIKGDESRTGAYAVSLDRRTTKTSLEGRRLSFGGQSQSQAQITSQLSYLLFELIAGNFADSRSTTVVQYAPRYRLAFTLLNEDAAEGGGVSGWDVQEAIASEIQPVLDRLNVLHNFTIESQVQFYAPLAFVPERIPGTESEVAYGLTHEQLTVFVNSAEWSLSSGVSNDPVLHFLLFVPSASRRPLRILEPNGDISTSNAFSFPQWGSVVIYNPPSPSSPSHLTHGDLAQPFSTFRSQLLSLLGVPSLPAGLASSSPTPISDWQLDALLRKRAVENARGSGEALNSIVTLVDQISGMPVHRDVRGDIEEALDALEQLYTLASHSAHSALEQSSKALALASRAFFNPGMLALLYFPPEHNLAVYTPLLAPIAVPLVVSVLRELSAWRKARKNVSSR